MRILVFTPTYGDGPRDETVESVEKQIPRSAQYDSQKFELTHEISWHNPYSDLDPRNILAQYQRGREMALAGDYDALLTVEHDMLLPSEALQRLWDTGESVAYGVYLFRHSTPALNVWEYLEKSRELGRSLSLQPNKLHRAQRRSIVRVSGVGFGCTLIRRPTLEEIPFRSGENNTEAPDVPFARDCLANDVTQVAHFGVLCGHWNGKRWLMPLGSVEMGDTIHVRARRNITVRLGGGTKELIAGHEYDLPDYEVPSLERTGCVTVIPSPAMPVC